MLNQALDAYSLSNAEPLKNTTGLINDTFIINDEFVLQRINSGVFHDHHALMKNFYTASKHLNEKGCFSDSITPILTNHGKPFFIDEDGAIWRCYHFIKGKTFLKPKDTAMIFQTGKAYGEFHMALSDIKEDALSKHSAALHDPIQRYEELLDAIKRDPYDRTKEIGSELLYIEEGIDFLRLLASQISSAPKRPVHNDAKISNILFDETSNERICVVDLDTVSFGFLLYDFGDMVRSCLKSSTDILAGFEAVFSGWYEHTAPLLTDFEETLIVVSCIAVTRELISRYIADYLNGEVYFHLSAPGDTLKKARELIDFCKRYEDSYFKLEELLENIIKRMKAS